MNSFDKFNLLPSLCEGLRANDLITPTEIQDLAIPGLLRGESLVGLAETGSGKTLAYVLPILHLLKTLENDGKPVKEVSRPRALVLVPTRELGEQVSKVFKTFTHATRLRVRSALGGTSMVQAKKNIAGAFEVLVVTPGRVLTLLEQGLVLKDVRIVVFDEADLMLDQSFLPAATRILKACPPDPQMVLCSATISATVEELISTSFAGVEVLKSDGSHRLVPTLTTQNKTVIHGKRFPLLEEFLLGGVKGGTLIFANTREQCNKLAEELTAKKVKCGMYCGEMDKLERKQNLKKFREGEIDFLISTDLASRGLDLENIECVINYHLPKDLDNYIHRVGRTARAGKKGLAINFVTERDKRLIEKLKKL
jgi:ATP-dependent RNA helicase RhlE